MKACPTVQACQNTALELCPSTRARDKLVPGVNDGDAGPGPGVNTFDVSLTQDVIIKGPVAVRPVYKYNKVGK